MIELGKQPDDEWLDCAKQVLHYSPDTGEFTWLKSQGRQKAGTVAGTTRGIYKYIRVNNSVRLAHRAAFAWVYGYWPPQHVDHINGDKRDNRIVNLRAATNKQNSANSPRRKDNTSGFKGVRRARTAGKWWAQIYADGRLRYIGTYDTPEEAHGAYLKAAEIEFGQFVRAS
jgi:hypothetical protein